MDVASYEAGKIRCRKLWKSK